MVWSPLLCSASNAHSIQAAVPRRIGEPLGDNPNSTPLNLSLRDRANFVLSCCWCAASTLMQNRPVALIRGQVEDVLETQSRTSGGSSDNEENDWHVKP